MVDLGFELAKREALMHALAEQFVQNSVLETNWLKSVDFGWGAERLKDTSKGIWNPSAYAATLTIVSDPASEYDDGDHGDSLYRYSYEKRPAGQDPRGGSNAKLREAMRLQLPIVMLRKIGNAKFVPVMPVFVVKDEPEHQRFLLALDESLRLVPDPAHLTDIERRYAEKVVRRRMHQPEFRGRVMLAYRTQCAVCRLQHGRLLDAAHIIGDADTDGAPVLANGLALCKIHHAAYDADIMGISPDYRVRIRPSVLLERDGPMLRHGLQEMNDAPLHLPSKRADRPDPERLATRFASFSAAS